MTSSLTSHGLIPRALAYRARRDRPIWARRPERRLNSFAHSGLKLLLAVTGCTPQNLVAARKSERMFARRLVVMPAARGLMVLSRAAIQGMSSGRAAGSSPSRFATHFTADRRSRRRVADSSPEQSSAASMDARVIASTGKSLQERFLVARVMDHSFREGPTWSREDSGRL